MLATFGPIWSIDRFSLLSSTASDDELYWRLATIVAYYTLFGLALGGSQLRKAWLILRCRHHPHPGQFIIRRTRVTSGPMAKLHAASFALVGLLAVAGVGYGWMAMQVPALFLGIGEYRSDAPADCPPESPGVGEDARKSADGGP